MALLVPVIAGSPKILGNFAATWREPYSEMGRKLRDLRQQGDTLAVDGTLLELHVESGLPAASSTLLSLAATSSVDATVRRLRAGLPKELDHARPSLVVVAAGREADGGRDALPSLTRYLADYYRAWWLDSVGNTLYVGFPRLARMERGSTTSRMISLAEVHILHSTGEINPLDDYRWFAHAPSAFECSMPENAARVQGTIGFLPSAYENPATATDGATFRVEAVDANGGIRTLFVRALSPTTAIADREPIPFTVELPRQSTRNVRFVIAPGRGNNCDWTFWGGLKFEIESAGR